MITKPNVFAGRIELQQQRYGERCIRETGAHELNPIGFQFATIWKKKNLRATLGLPTARSFTLLFSFLGFRVFALPMQRGRMTIVCVGSTCS